MQLVVRDCAVRLVVGEDGSQLGWAMVRVFACSSWRHATVGVINPTRHDTRNAPARDQTSWAVGPGAGETSVVAGADGALLEEEEEEKKPPRAAAGGGGGAAAAGRGGTKGFLPWASSSCSRLERPCAP